MEMISIDRLCLTKGSFSLDNISLEIKKNEIFAVLGKTGSGKTLLLESIAGYYDDYKGNIMIGLQNVRNLELSERRIGFVYQDYGLFSHMTVEKNIGYGLKMKKLSREQINDKVNEIADIMGITHILGEYPATLSGGEKQRTALARALIMDPEILLLDEPFSAMDPMTKNVMYDEIKKIKEKYMCTILFVTHDFNEAQTLADRIGIMVNGRLQTIRSRENLFELSGDVAVDRFLGVSC